MDVIIYELRGSEKGLQRVPFLLHSIWGRKPRGHSVCP
nr:MAG TPA: hypothetical protein [Caudoviricetes sp.]